MMRKKNAGHYSMELGDFVLTSIHDGRLKREVGEKHLSAGDPEDIRRAFKAVGNAPGWFEWSFNPLLVETPEETILIDTGQGPHGTPGTGKLMENLKAYGVEPGDVDVVLLSHFHGDHINGLLDPEGEAAFPNARIIAPAPEHEFWMADHPEAEMPGRMPLHQAAARKIFGMFGNRTTLVNWGDTVLPGIEAVEAKGHTPGHTAFRITSGGRSVLYAGDISNNPNIFARFTDFVGHFDYRPEDMLATRARLFGELADTGDIVYIFHASFPSFGYLTRSETGFDYRPVTWWQG